MATFDSDSFAGTTGTLLSAHAPTTAGGSWAIATGTTATAQLTSAGRLRGTTASGEADYLCQGTPAGADYDVQADLWTGTTPGNYAGVFGRADASAGVNASTGLAYLGQYDHTTGAWTIQKAVHNVFSQVGSSSAATLTNSTLNTFQLSMRGASLVLNVGGVAKVTTTDSSVTAAGKAGAFVNSSTASDGVSYELDNFSAADPVAASGFPPIPAVWYNKLLPQ